jgi:hypothetical protein
MFREITKAVLATLRDTLRSRAAQLRTKTFWIFVRASATSAKLQKEFALP